MILDLVIFTFLNLNSNIVSLRNNDVVGGLSVMSGGNCLGGRDAALAEEEVTRKKRKPEHS